MNGFLQTVGNRVIAACQETGDAVVLLGRSLQECRHAFAHPHRIFVQMKRIGNDTAFMASAVALFVGMVLALHTGYTLRNFEAEEAMAAVVAFSMIKEMGPVITGLLLAGRIGAAIAAEVATMQINEEIDALHTLGINPVRFLAMPRLIGCVTMLPVLVLCASMVGILGGAAVASVYFDISFHAYFDNAFEYMEMSDVAEGFIKAALFGAIVAVVACQRGFRTRGGAEGVGRAITSGVVTSFVCIIICDYFVTRFML